MYFIQFVIRITDYYILIPSIIDINTFVSTVLDTIMDLNTIRVYNNIAVTILDNSLNRITHHQILYNIHLILNLLNILNNMVISTHYFILLV